LFPNLNLIDIYPLIKLDKQLFSSVYRYLLICLPIPFPLSVYCCLPTVVRSIVVCLPAYRLSTVVCLPLSASVVCY